MGSAALPQFPHSTTVPVRSLHRPSGPSPALVTAIPSCPQTHSSPLCLGVTAEPPGPGTHPRASSFLRQTQQQQSRESRRMSSNARRAPAPITPIRWLASARQKAGRSGPVMAQRQSPAPRPVPAGTHPCGRHPSAGRRCRRGSCRLRRSWLRSGRAGKSGYSWREGGK